MLTSMFSAAMSRRLFVLAGLLALAACSSSNQVRFDARPERVMHGDEVNFFSDLESMTVGSDLVVEARVTAVAPGRWIGPPGGGDRDRVRSITLVVERLLYSADGYSPTSLKLDEWGWDSEGRGYQFENVTWTKPGDGGFYFLRKTEVAGNYALVSSQGRLLRARTTLVSSAGEEDPLRARLEAYTPQNLRTQVGRAVVKVRAGTLKRPPELPAPLVSAGVAP